MSSSLPSSVDSKLKYKPGAIVQARKDSTPRIYKMPFEALNILHDGFNNRNGEEVYQHHLVTDKFLNLTGDEFLFIVHFFNSPSHIHYYPTSEELIKEHPSTQQHLHAADHQTVVAYFMYDNAIWATEIYKTVDGFLLDYKIIVE